MTKRREFIRDFAAITGGCLFLPSMASASGWQKDKGWHRYAATAVVPPEVRFPPEKRVPLGWKAFPVSALPAKGAHTVLRFPKVNRASKPVWLRITAAIDFREELVVSAFLPATGTELGQFDIRYAHPFQPFEIPLDPSFLPEINGQGIALRLIKGQKDAWFFQPDTSRTDNAGLQPHLLIGQSKDPARAFRQNMLSMNSFSPFGWMGGNVQDALWEMAQRGDKEALPVLKKQLEAYLHSEKGITFESPMTEPRDGTFNSIEDFLPFAAILNLYPRHPSVQLALDYLKSKENAEGLIVSGNDVTTEACYTVAYPLAAMAVQRKDPRLAQTALNQLLLRQRYLTNETTIFQRSSLQGHQSYANWGRGIAWYLLGSVKTLAVLKDLGAQELKGIPEVQQEFKRAVAAVSPWQNQEGMWCSFIDRPETGIDTSATAGIAAAMGWGVRLGLLDSSVVAKARQASASTRRFLTPDGFLTQVSQINRGGEDLQAGGYRVISQFGMGLLAQLETVLPG